MPHGTIRRCRPALPPRPRPAWIVVPDIGQGGASVATVRPVELATDDVAVARRSRAERSKLRRELGRLDAVCLLISAIVVLDTLGAVAKGGAQTLTWLAVVAALFFVPAGLVIAELGAAFPNQGGPYVWARLAFGRYAGSLVALGFVWATVALAALPLRAGKRVPWPGRPPRSACSAASPRR